MRWPWSKREKMTEIAGLTEDEFKREVRLLHESAAVQRIFDAINTQYAREWLDCQDKDRREHLHRMSQAVTAFRNSLASIANDSRVTERNQRVAKIQSVR